MHLPSLHVRTLRLVYSAALVVLGIVFLLPLAWIVLASVDREATLAVTWPKALSLDNFASVLTPELAAKPLWNSVVLSVGCGVVTVVLATLAAYPLSRYPSRFSRSFIYALLLATSLPITALMVPVYSLFVWLNLIDSVGATMLFLAATSLPIAIWMMTNFINGIPMSLEEAAWVDGASNVRTLWSVVVPLVRAGSAVVFIFTFVNAWGTFFIPFVLLLSEGNQPAAVTIFNFFGQHGRVDYGLLAAYSVVYSVPVLALYVLVSRRLGGVASMTGGLKG